MVGLIISGHGNFASGLRTSLKLIAGEASNIEYVDLSETALEVGKSGVVKFEFIVHEDIDCEGGI